MATAVVLLSGGMDSATCLAIATASGYQCHALSFDYGQKQRAELHAARQLSELHEATHHVLPLPVACFAGSALTDKSVDIPEHNESKGIPTTYVPARNTIFLSMALGLAETLSAEAIFIGVSAVDYSGYPDCRPEFIQAFEHMANLATKSAIEGQAIRLHAPLIHLSKAQTIQLGVSLGIDYSQTITCYQADHEGLACGHCDSCILRQRGFEEAGIPDNTRYQAS